MTSIFSVQKVKKKKQKKNGSPIYIMTLFDEEASLFSLRAEEGI